METTALEPLPPAAAPRVCSDVDGGCVAGPELDPGWGCECGPVASSASPALALILVLPIVVWRGRRRRRG